MKDVFIALFLVFVGGVAWVAVPLAGAIVAPGLAIIFLYYVVKEINKERANHESGTEENT